MNTILRSSGIKKKNFIRLKDKTFAEYKFIYHINDGYSIKKLSDFSSKHQLLFQRMGNKIQQINLMLVDSVFPLILVDLVQEVFLKRVESILQYIDSKNKIVIEDTQFDKNYLRYKFDNFIHLLLYSNIASDKVCKSDFKADKIYYLNNTKGVIMYYSIYDLKELQDLLLQKMKLEINIDKSYIKNKNASLYMKIRY